MPNPSEETDESLMVRIVNADQRAFATLVERHSSLFYAAAYRICGHAQEAEDIVQDAFLKLWSRPAAYDAGKGAKFTTWFYRVVTNTGIDAARRKKPNGGGDEVIAFIPDGGPAADDELVMNEQQTALEAAIQGLPERQKLALNLCFYEGLSNKDAAEILGVGVKALESLLMRAKTALKDQFEGYDDRKEASHG